MTDFSFADTQYGLGEAAARRRYSQSMLGSQYSRDQLGQQTQQSIRDLSKAYRQAAPSQITQFTGRGLGRSGLFKQAMQDFATKQQEDLASVYRSQSDQQAALALQEQQYAQALQDELDRLQLQRQQQLLADAAALKDYAPLV